MLRWGTLGILGLMWWHLLIIASTPHRFHPDEAFFMTFARNASVGGDWELSGDLDKPPLTIYANALFLSVAGVDTLPNGVLTLDPYKGEFVGRLFSIFCAVIATALVMRVVWESSKHLKAVLLAGMSLFLAPLWGVYGASAFMDMPLLALAWGSVWASLRRQPLWAGALLALAFCAKPQAIFFLPIVGACVWWLGGMRHFFLFGWVLALGLGGLWAWDSTRPQSTFALGASHNLTEFIPKASLPLEALFGAITPLFVLLAGIGFITQRNTLKTMYGVWGIGYLLVHLLLPMPFYERYLLLIVPLFAWFLGESVAQWRGTTWVIMGTMIFFFVLLGRLSHTERADWVGNSQVDELAQAINALPLASVVYDPFFGWEMGYYLGQWTNKRRVHYPTPQTLIDGIFALNEQGTRYLVLPKQAFLERQALADAMRQALTQNDITLTPIQDYKNMVLYALTLP